MWMWPFLLIVTLTIAQDASPSFNGVWRLDPKEVGSSDAVLELIGVGPFQRHIIASLEVTERYAVTPETLRVARDTAVSHTDDTWHWGQLYTVQDLVLGHCEQTVTLTPQNHIVTLATRPDRSQYHSVRKLQPGGLTFSNTINFTASDGHQASCVRFYNRMVRQRAVDE